MRDPNAKTLVNKALADEMRASLGGARKVQRHSSGATHVSRPTVSESGGAESSGHSAPSTPTP